jgi:apolipoprotein N-acyltransferase
VLTPLLLTLVSAILYTLSFPPFSFSTCAWVALAPFFIAAAGTSPIVAAGCGVLLALGVAFGVAWWLPSMIADYLKISPWIGWAGFFAVSLGLAGFYCAAFAVWLSWLTRRQVVTPLLVAAGWGVCEFARATVFIGNPWVLLGYSQISHPQLMQIADATGPYGVGMLLAAVSACVAGLFSPTLRGRQPVVSRTSDTVGKIPPIPPLTKGGIQKPPFVKGAARSAGGFWGAAVEKRTFANSITFVGMLLVTTLAYGQWRLSQTFTDGNAIQVAVVQPAIERQHRWSRDHWRANLDQYLTLTQTAANADLIFWPEHAVDFLLQKPSHYRDAVLRVTQDTSADLILGSRHFGYGEKDVFFHNSVFLVRRGKLAGRYDKRVLVPFAEENPLPRFLPNIASKYQEGRRALPLPANAARVGAFVCFESMYPDLVRQLAVRGAQVLANPSNDDWFGNAAAARHQLDIASLRAIENRRYLVRATATGYSAVIDPYGRTVALSGFGSPEVLTAEIHPSRVRTPYQRWGDILCWVAIFGVLGVSLFSINWLTLMQIFRRRRTS